MPQTATETKGKVFEVTAAHYEEGFIEGFIAPIVLPSQEELFDYQVETLVTKCLAQYADADSFRKRIPEKRLFLLIPSPPKVLDLGEVMGKVQLSGKRGVNYLDVSCLKDLGEYPTTASLLVDVEDGRARLNTRPGVSRMNVKREGRHPYNTWRGIIHVACMPWVLSHHNLDLVGSQYFEGFAPVLCVLVDRPALHYNWEDDAAPQWGAPSAGSVLVP